MITAGSKNQDNDDEEGDEAKKDSKEEKVSKSKGSVLIEENDSHEESKYIYTYSGFDGSITANPKFYKGRLQSRHQKMLMEDKS